MALQSGEEIVAHPRREFDAWLLGGNNKALICRAGKGEGDFPEVPATFSYGVESGDTEEEIRAAVELLRAALPPRTKGEVREIPAGWTSQNLRMGDRIGVLIRFHRDGGARLRVSVNGNVCYSHEFVDAPPADAVGFLTPIVRLAGTGKSAKLL